MHGVKVTKSHNVNNNNNNNNKARVLTLLVFFCFRSVVHWIAVQVLPLQILHVYLYP